MRAIRTAVRGLAPLAAAVAVMAVPAAAAAAPAKWTEYNGTPIDTVTADISGNVDLEFVGVGGQLESSCEVTGEIELSNDGAGGTAIQKIVNLQPVDADPYGPYVCEGYWVGYPTYEVTYNTPWTGSSTVAPRKSTFDIQMSTQWGDQYGLQVPTAGSLPTTPYNVQVGSNSCVGYFGASQVFMYGPGGWNVNVTATFELDLGTLEGLSTQAGGPCVKLAAA